MRLRAFNEDGIVEASRILDAIRAEELSSVPREFLENDEFSHMVGPSIARPKKDELPSRWRFGLWLYQRLENSIDERALYNLPGLWTWLAFLLFDTICPEKLGKRRLAEDAKYILSRGDYRKSYRHLVSGPYYIIRTHIDAPSVVRALLSNPPDAPGDVYEQLASRKQIVTSGAAMRVANRLYWDDRNERVRKGAAGAGAGSARRYATVLMQYDVTFDLYAITQDRLEEMLPSEFDRFLRRRAS